MWQNVYRNKNIGQILFYLNIQFIWIYVKLSKITTTLIYEITQKYKVHITYFLVLYNSDFDIFFSKYHSFFLFKYIWKRGALTPNKGDPYEYPEWGIRFSESKQNYEQNGIWFVWSRFKSQIFANGPWLYTQQRAKLQAQLHIQLHIQLHTQLHSQLHTNTERPTYTVAQLYCFTRARVCLRL